MANDGEQRATKKEKGHLQSNSFTVVSKAKPVTIQSNERPNFLFPSLPAISYDASNLRVQTVGVSVQNDIDATSASRGDDRVLESKVDSHNTAHIG